MTEATLLSIAELRRYLLRSTKVVLQNTEPEVNHLIDGKERVVCDIEFCGTDPPRRPVLSALCCPPGLQTAAATRRRPSSRGETGSPQSSDNEHSSGRLQTDTGRGWVGGWGVTLTGQKQ